MSHDPSQQSRDGLCLTPCGRCETSGMCFDRRTRLGLNTEPTVAYLRELEASMVESLASAEQSVAVRRAKLYDIRQKIHSAIIRGI